MFLKIHPDNPAQRQIDRTAEILLNGGTAIYPTDTVYAFGCDMLKRNAFEKIAKIKGVKTSKANFSLICHNLSHIADFARIDTPIFKLMKKATPGPYTFILRATSAVPRIFQSNKKTIGIRIPNHHIPLQIVKKIGRPLLTSSIHNNEDIIEYLTDPELIYERYAKQVDVVISGGYGGNVPSTVVDCTEGEPIVLRQGAGDIGRFL